MRELNKIYKILESYKPDDEYYKGYLSKTYGNARRTKYVLYASIITGVFVIVLTFLLFSINGMSSWNGVIQYAVATLISLGIGIIYVGLVNYFFCRDLPEEDVDYLNGVFRRNFVTDNDRDTRIRSRGNKLVIVDKGNKVYSTELVGNMDMYSLSIEKYYEMKLSGLVTEMVDCIIMYGDMVVDTVNLEGIVIDANF